MREVKTKNLACFLFSLTKISCTLRQCVRGSALFRDGNVLLKQRSWNIIARDLHRHAACSPRSTLIILFTVFNNYAATSTWCPLMFARDPQRTFARDKFNYFRQSIIKHANELIINSATTVKRATRLAGALLRRFRVIFHR